MNTDRSAYCFQSPTQMMYVHRHWVRGQLGIVAIELLFQHGSRYDSAQAAQELFQQRQPLAGKLQAPPCNRNLAADAVEGKIAHRQHRAKRHAGVAQQHLDSGE